jgi:hypothetical protein
LILLQDDIDLNSRADALSLLTVHQASGYIGGTVKCKGSAIPCRAQSRSLPS